MGENAPKFNRRKEARPGELVAAARIEFAERGYGDAKLARIAKRAGVSNGTLYHYFSDKAELFREVLRSAFVDPIASGDLKAPPEGPDDPLLLALDRLFDGDAVALLSILMFEARRYPDPVGATATIVMENVETVLVAYLQSSDFEAERRPAHPLSLVSQSLGLALMERARGRPDWAETARASAREQVARLKA